MTMHLVGPWITTTNLKKRKAKNKTKSLIAAEKEHEKFLKKMGLAPVAQLVERPAYTRLSGRLPRGGGSSPSGGTNSRDLAQSGRAGALGVSGRKFESSNPDQFYNETAAKKSEKMYTGTEIIGIATMHKSNAVPVLGKKQAQEVAKMRRG